MRDDDVHASIEGSSVTRLVTKEQYFKVALGILAAEGPGGLGIGVMCRRFNVTSGSFYHHFGNWPGFVDELLRYWEALQVDALRKQRFGTAGPHADIELLKQLTLGLNHRAEAAIRAWGANDERVREVRARVDDARRKTVQKAVLGVVSHRDVAREITALGMAMLVGYQQIADSVAESSLGLLLDEYVMLISACAPK